jgi:hypothetical protein
VLSLASALSLQAANAAMVSLRFLFFQFDCCIACLLFVYVGALLTSIGLMLPFPYKCNDESCFLSESNNESCLIALSYCKVIVLRRDVLEYLNERLCVLLY